MTQSTKDPLLDCLLHFTQHYHKVSSPQALVAGLPLEQDRLTLDSFIHAADRVGLSATVKEITLTKITADMLPLVLILNEKRACILKEVTPDHAKIIRPELGADLQEIPIAELANEYSGCCVYVTDSHQFDTRTDDTETKTSREWFWKVMLRGWAAYGEILVASFLINTFALASPLFIMNVYDRVVPNQATATLWVLSSGVFIVFIFDFIMRNLRAYFIDAAGRNIDIQLSKNIFSHLLDIQMGERPNSVGSLANTVQSFESFREFVTSTTVSILVDIPFVILFLIAIALIGGWIVVVPIVAIPLVLLFGYLIQRPLDRMIRTSHRYSSEKNAVLIETLSSMETIKGMHIEGFLQSRWESVVDAASRLSIKLRTLATLGINFSMLVQQLAVVTLVIVGVMSIVNGNITVGALIACTILVSRVLAPIAQIAGLLARYEQCKAAIQALDKVMQLPTERPKESTFLYLSKLDGEVEFRNVSFNYPLQTVAAVKNINFHIRPGEKIAIIGATGSGKSTIIKLIMKFYTATSGNILLDQFEQHQLDPAELRHFIGYVPQDITLFHGTIKENIVYGAPHVDDKDIIRAAKLSTIDTFVAHHPDGFNRPVGERGQFLSGGQRQAVVISRALVLNPPILLFDELSNAMDDKTTTLLLEQLKTIIANKTVVLVTHKAMMLEIVDRLIVMDNGYIVADGPKEDVLKQLTERKIRVHAPTT